MKVFKTTLNEFKTRDKYIREDYRCQDDDNWTKTIRHVSIYQVQRQILQAESKEDYSHVGRERASQFGETSFVKSLIAETFSR